MTFIMIYIIADIYTYILYTYIHITKVKKLLRSHKWMAEMLLDIEMECYTGRKYNWKVLKLRLES